MQSLKKYSNIELNSYEQTCHVNTVTVFTPTDAAALINSNRSGYSVKLGAALIKKLLFKCWDLHKKNVNFVS